MKRSIIVAVVASSLLGLMMVGCSGGGGGDDPGGGGGGVAETPSFSLAWSEYPSWSAFGVAHELKIINGEKGELGPVEKKWNVDIELKEADYDPCIQMYNTGAVDAVCMTNMDSLNPALSLTSVAVCPTSTSIGADACIVVGIDDVVALRDHKVFGLAKSVSEYTFIRNLTKLGENEADHNFTNMDPGAAAQAMVTGSPDHKAIVVWNPFVLSTLGSAEGAKVLFDSSGIPEEIIDMVVVAKASLDKPGGKDFACAVLETFYKVNQMIEDPKTHDQTLISLGARFSSLGLEDMEKVVTQTKFYNTPDAGLELFNGGGFFTEQKFTETMDMIVDFCQDHEIVPEKPTVFFGPTDKAGDAQFILDPTYMESVKQKMEE